MSLEIEIRELAAKWRRERLDYPVNEPGASYAFIAVKLCEEELLELVNSWADRNPEWEQLDLFGGGCSV